MIPIFNHPARATWSDLLRRDESNDESLTARVTAIIDRVRQAGDEALLQLAREIDGWANPQLEVPSETLAAAAGAVAPALRKAIDTAAGNIRRFHEAQRSAGVDIETMPGVRCLQRSVPIRRVGLYIPGGTAPLFSTVLMLAIPAQVAGCSEIVLCTPPARDGALRPEMLYAASVCGLSRIFRIGGAQAIAAMAYGTETIPRVDKIFGPGNRYVTRAKQLVSVSQVAIDMPAGPSEVMIVADASADAGFVAADVLSQLEHGSDSQAIAVVDSLALATEIAQSIAVQIEQLPRRALAAQALANSKIVVLSERQAMMDFANAYAAEHLILSVNDAWDAAAQITAAGSVFIGNYSPESAGDYASGTNHTLPTAGWASACSGVNVDSFTRKITYQELTPQGLAGLSDTIVAMAEAEGLDAHAQAVRIRLNAIQS
jgi:histidinol dehydrogenase